MEAMPSLDCTQALPVELDWLRTDLPRRCRNSSRSNNNVSGSSPLSLISSASSSPPPSAAQSDSFEAAKVMTPSQPKDRQTTAGTNLNALERRTSRTDADIATTDEGKTKTRNNRGKTRRLNLTPVLATRSNSFTVPSLALQASYCCDNLHNCGHSCAEEQIRMPSPQRTSNAITSQQVNVPSRRASCSAVFPARGRHELAAMQCFAADEQSLALANPRDMRHAHTGNIAQSHIISSTTSFCSSHENLAHSPSLDPADSLFVGEDSIPMLTDSLNHVQLALCNPPDTARYDLSANGLLAQACDAGNGNALTGKHVCSICGDRASGKHYAVYSCEGCKGFFKRTVRKDLRESRDCIIDKRQRNRCQYCRYQKCLFMGMKREAVQEERNRQRGNNDRSMRLNVANGSAHVRNGKECSRALQPQHAIGAYDDDSEEQPESTSNMLPEMPSHQIFAAELLIDQMQEHHDSFQTEQAMDTVETVEHQLRQLIDWARNIPRFIELTFDDQALLLHAGWMELILAALSYRSTTDLLLLSSGQRIDRSTAFAIGVVDIFDRISVELTQKFLSLNVDQTEIGCLRSIILFNPDATGLNCSVHVESIREKVYCCLEEYCRSLQPNQTGRFAKLLLRLPALRSVGLKCLDLSFNVIPPVPSLACLVQMLKTRPHVRV